MNRSPPGSANRGVALISVLWLVALLTLLATSTVMISRSRARIAKSTLDSVQSMLILDSAIRRTLAELASHAATVEAALSRKSTVLLDETVSVRVDLERQRTNLNKASVKELARVFGLNGWTEQKAHLIATRVQEWRDASNEPQRLGGDVAAYGAAGMRYRPRHGAFESIDELAQVLGAGRLPIELHDSLTVYADSGAEVAASSANTQPTPTQTIDAIRGGEVIRVQACTSGSSAGACRRAVVRLTGNRRSPIQVFAWY